MATTSDVSPNTKKSEKSELGTGFPIAIHTAASVSLSQEKGLTDQQSLFDASEGAASTGAQRCAIALFALASIRGVGFGTIKYLCDEFRGDLSRVFREDQSTLAEMLYDARTPNPQAVAQEIKVRARALVAEGKRTWAKYRAKGVSVVFRDQPEYPAALLDLASPPSWLFVEGNVELLYSPFLVGFVGTRVPTAEGQSTARRAAAFLAQSNAVIVSGLAEGIDAVGHETAVLFGTPTIAVLGHGIDVVFPQSTAEVRRNIVRFGGAVVSEYLPGDSYSADKFVSRNRLQAALSRAVCFVEAREKSGTAHTLRFAQQLNRPVFGVTMGGFRGIPEEELLHVLGRQGGKVFDIASDKSCLDLSSFIHQAFTQSADVPSNDAPRMFRNVALEVRRLAEEYGATKEDIDWLRRELSKIARKLGTEKPSVPKRP